MISGEVKIFHTTIGMATTGIFKAIPHGYHIRTIKLFDTREDATTKRSYLVSKCGMDEQRVDIFGPKTFMTYEDWHTLTRAEDIIKESKTNDKERQNRSKKLLAQTATTAGQERLKKN